MPSWTRQTVMAYLEQAVETDRALPGRVMPSGYRSFWPDIHLAPFEAMAAAQSRRRRPPPTPEAVQAWEQCQTLLRSLVQRGLPQEAGKVLWLCAAKMGIRKIGKRFGHNQKWAAQLRDRALDTLVCILGEEAS